MQLLERLHELDAAAFASAPGVDLRLDHEGLAPEVAGMRRSLLRGVGDAAFGHRGAVVPKQGLGLIFVNVHGRTRVRRSRAGLKGGAKGYGHNN